MRNFLDLILWASIGLAWAFITGSWVAESFYQRTLWSPLGIAFWSEVSLLVTAVSAIAFMAAFEKIEWPARLTQFVHWLGRLLTAASITTLTYIYFGESWRYFKAHDATWTGFVVYLVSLLVFIEVVTHDWYQRLYRWGLK